MDHLPQFRADIGIRDLLPVGSRLQDDVSGCHVVDVIIVVDTAG